MRNIINGVFSLVILIWGASSHAVDPVQIGPQQMKLPPVPKTINLVIHAFGWERELCTATCPEVNRDLHINKVNCGVSVRVANEGNTPSGAFSVQLLYTHWNGTSVLQKVQSVGAGLPAKNQPGSAKTIVFSNIGYYRSDKPFIVKVDWDNRITESNEGDNQKSLVLN